MEQASEGIAMWTISPVFPQKTSDKTQTQHYDKCETFLMLGFLTLAFVWTHLLSSSPLVRIRPSLRKSFQQISLKKIKTATSFMRLPMEMVDGCDQVLMPIIAMSMTSMASWVARSNLSYAS